MAGPKNLYEMPIVKQDYQVYDLIAEGEDQPSGGLSVDELNQMPVDDVVDVFLLGHQEKGETNEEKVSIDRASAILDGLDDSIKASVVEKLEVKLDREGHQACFEEFQLSLKKNQLTKVLIQSSGSSSALWRPPAEPQSPKISSPEPLLNHSSIYDDRSFGPLDDSGSRGGSQPLSLEDVDRLLSEFGGLMSDLQEELKPDYASATNAIKAMIEERGQEVSFYAFGEKHPDPQRLSQEVMTPKQYFARDVLPYLVREKGVTVVALETLFPDLEDDAENYLNSGKISSSLKTLMRHSQGLKETLDQVKILRDEGYPVEVRGTYYTIEQSVDFLIGDRRGQKTSVEEKAQVINQEVINIANEAKAKGKKVVFYNGWGHANENFTDITFTDSPIFDETNYIAFRLMVPFYDLYPNIESSPPQDKGVMLSEVENTRLSTYTLTFL